MMINELVAGIGLIGFILGLLIASKTKEEVVPGRKYLKKAKRVVLLISALFIFNYIQVYLLLVLAGAVLAYFIRKPLVYYGATLGAAATIPLVSMIGALSFIFGLLQGSLDFNKETKKTILVSLLSFLFAYVSFRLINLEVLVNAVAGAMLAESIFKK